ncbi:MAG: DUF456 family protein [Phycisphaeraceae bacterium]
MWDASLLVLVMVLLLLVNAGGVALVALQMPGTWLMLLCTAIVAGWRADWWMGYDGWGAMLAAGPITLWTLLFLLGLAVLGEIIEFIAGAAGAAKAGGSKRGAAGAIIGGIVGAILGTAAIPIPVVGTLVGAALGAGAGSILGDLWAGREWDITWAAGRGAAIGRFWGALGKLIVAVLMWLVTLAAILWP